MVTVDKWGNENAASKATLTLDLGTLTGNDLIGGKIVLGSTTIKVKQGTTAAAASVGTDGILYVGTQAKASKIASAIADAQSKVSAKFTSGTATDLEIKATGAKLTFTATTAGKELDALTIPEIKVSAGLNLQIGDTSQTYNQMNVGIADMHVSSLFISDIDISTQDGASDAINKIKNAINMVSSTRGDLGAVQNRLEHTQNNLSVMSENIQDAESTIRDTDVAEEMMSYTKNNILVQSAQAMLAQANSVPQGVLQLLQ
jgi:flagellin